MDAWSRSIEQRLDALEGGLSRRQSITDGDRRLGFVSTAHPPSNPVRYEMRKGELVVRAPTDIVEILELDGWRRIA